MKINISRKTVERGVYVAIVILLVLFGIFKDSEIAATLIHAVKEAFSILLNTP